MMDILMPEIFWAHKKWNKIASDIKLVFYSSAMCLTVFVPISLVIWRAKCEPCTHSSALNGLCLLYSRSGHRMPCFLGGSRRTGFGFFCDNTWRLSVVCYQPFERTHCLQYAGSKFHRKFLEPTIMRRHFMSQNGILNHTAVNILKSLKY